MPYIGLRFTEADDYVIMNHDGDDGGDTNIAADVDDGDDDDIDVRDDADGDDDDRDAVVGD